MGREYSKPFVRLEFRPDGDSKNWQKNRQQILREIRQLRLRAKKHKEVICSCDPGIEAVLQVKKWKMIFRRTEESWICNVWISPALALMLPKLMPGHLTSGVDETCGRYFLHFLTPEAFALGIAVHRYWMDVGQKSLAKQKTHECSR